MNVLGKLLAWMWVVVCSGMLTACIQDEAPNAEADITTCSLDGDILLRAPEITNNEVKLYVNGWNDVTRLAPVFTLTPGATISPQSGTTLDFSTPQTYTVTSQDGKWNKVYKVSVLSDEPVTTYHFENMRFYEYKDEWDPSAPAQQRFHIFYETGIDGKELTWGSGNPGYMITNANTKAEDYPTSQSANGYQGKCAKLTTVSTGALGAMFGAPIAAGNLFLGTFELNFGNMAKSTHFGVPFSKLPLALTGYYKYKPGPKLTDKSNKEIEGRDACDIYAVLYEVTTEVPYLDGTNSLTSPTIVLMARLDEQQGDDQWHKFALEFKPVEGRSVDTAKLQAGKYSLAIVMTSSRNGATFTGAVGSTLYVDEMNLYYQ